MIQQNRYEIIIKPQEIRFEVELDVTVKVKDVFEEFKNLPNVQGVDVNNWTCFSVQRKKYLQIDEEIGNFQREILEINTQPQQLQQSQSPQVIENINVKIVIKDGAIDRMLDAVFKTNNTLDDVANTVQQYCALEIDNKTTAIDIFIFGQPYNDKVKRGKPMSDLQLKDNLTIDAKIRWIGG
ncbi:unnamed protein product (macronuclear) [Paramecium tetraurelia]|uniref:Ubiquitin-like domain-containing protein n=1 Tax=Paramecium tetraurelia TaxID=5888 RepID=A0CMB0_PARTE|nr:uncharacterized protein GSPATT00008406001 [Paramecium tetraurelia]CAK71927.1 unnamed protein product [Paramecium tetraurelia]|eukprot:XP_001439324.1 hypothetical protein (macronuclear) [Paramecium tetraurelia strain d4-2]